MPVLRGDSSDSFIRPPGVAALPSEESQPPSLPHLRVDHPEAGGRVALVRLEEFPHKLLQTAWRIAAGHAEAVVEVYLIVIGKTATGYSAHCPDVEGCAAVGRTVEAVVPNMREALEFHFEGIHEDGDPVPHPGGVAAYSEAMKDLDLDRHFLAHVRIDARRLAAAPSHV